jgi:hypothetical protein
MRVCGQRDAAGRLDAIEPGHAVVEQQQVGLVVDAQAQAVAPIPRRTHDFEPLLLGQQRGESLPHQLLFVREDDTNRAVHSL